MAEKKLTPEEVRALGLNEPAPSEAPPEEEPMEAPPAEEPGLVASMGRAFSKGATGRWSDELGAYLESKFPVLGLTPGEWLEGKQAKPGSYDEKLRDIRGLIKSSEEAWPIPTAASEFVGDLGLQGALAAGTGGASVTPMGQGALGAVSALGASEANLHGGGGPKDYKRAALEALAGGALSAAGTKVGTAVGEKLSPMLRAGAKKVSGGLERFAHRRAAKATGMTLADYRALLEKGGQADIESGFGADEAIDRLGKRLMDEQLVRAFDRSEDIARRVGPQVNQAASDIDRLVAEVQKADPGAGVDPGRIAQKLYAMASEYRKNPALANAADAVEKEAKKFAEKSIDDPFAKGSLAEGREWVRGYDKQLNWNKEQSVPLEAVKRLRTALKEEVEGGVEAGGGPQALEWFKGAKRRYGELKDVSDIAKDAALRSQANRWTSPSDYITGAAALGGGLAAGQGVKGALVAGLVTLAHKLARERGSSTMAVGGKAAAQVLDEVMPMLLSKGAFGRYTPAIAREYEQHGLWSALGMAESVAEEPTDAGR
jgi:hypothetical protein